MSGRKFVRGIVLYLGEDSVPFGSGMVALPVSSVWRLGGERAACEARPRPTLVTSGRGR